MSDIIFKHQDLDKYDGYVPSKREFIQDSYYVSGAIDMFHIPSGYAHRGRSRGFGFGIQKKMWQASRRGINVDSHDVGASDM